VAERSAAVERDLLYFGNVLLGESRVNPMPRREVVGGSHLLQLLNAYRVLVILRQTWVLQKLENTVFVDSFEHAGDLQFRVRISPLEDRVDPFQHLLFQGVFTATLALKDREGLHENDGRLVELERKIRDHGNQNRAADVASQGFLLVFRVLH
jgi:hypothetical protein